MKGLLDMTDEERSTVWDHLPAESEFKQMTLDEFLAMCREFVQDFQELGRVESDG
jgi:hypothetical protein